MKTFLCALAVAFVCSSVAQAQVSVRGYYSGSGRYVQPHHRSSPDASYNNNWSVSPNVNPYTGRAGTLSPTSNDRPPQRSSFDRPSMLTPSSSMMRSSLYGR
jgi:hypothetical protein